MTPKKPLNFEDPDFLKDCRCGHNGYSHAHPGDLPFEDKNEMLLHLYLSVRDYLEDCACELCHCDTFAFPDEYEPLWELDDFMGESPVFD